MNMLFDLALLLPEILKAHDGDIQKQGSKDTWTEMLSAPSFILAKPGTA